MSKMRDKELIAWQCDVKVGDVVTVRHWVTGLAKSQVILDGCFLQLLGSIYPPDYFDAAPAGGRWVDVSSGELPNHDDFVWVQHKGGGVRQLRKSEFFCVDRWFDDGKLPGPPPIKNPRIAELRELTKLQSLALAANKAELAETEAELAKLVGGAS